MEKGQFVSLTRRKGMKKINDYRKYMEEKEVSDTYEAAFYYMHGAEVVSFRVEEVPYREYSKKLYHNQWFIYMKNIPAEAIYDWKNGYAVENLLSFSRARRKIKRIIFMNDYQETPKIKASSLGL